MRIGLLTEGGYPYASGDAGLWCDRLVRGLGQHEFDIYALSDGPHQEESGCVTLPPQVRGVRTAPLWTAEEDGVMYGRRARRRFTECYGDLVTALCDSSPSQADRFASALYGLAELARDQGGLVGALRSEGAVRALERACRAPGALRTAREARVPELLTVAGQLERALRPLSLDWYGPDGPDGSTLGSVDLCHAASGGPAALPGLLARHFHDVPLLVTEYGVRLRTHYLNSGAPGGSASDASPAVRALLAAFHGLLAAETYRQAARLAPGNAHARRWQEHCGADRAKVRTVHPGMDAAPFADVGDAPDTADPHTLVWVGRVEPAKDLVSLLHAFAQVRTEQPRARLRIVGTSAGPEGRAYLGHCRVLAAQLFPDEAEGPHAVGDNPVSFEELGGPEAPTLAETYAAGAVVVLSSVVEGFPLGLVEAMFCGRATVSTDVGAVVEVVGGTGLVVPPRNPRALAQACGALLRDPERRARLGAAARARALELFTVEQNVEAYHGIYLEIVSQCPALGGVLDEAGDPRPFAVPAEARLPGRWTGLGARVTARRSPGWPAGPPVRGASARVGSAAGTAVRGTPAPDTAVRGSTPAPDTAVRGSAPAPGGPAPGAPAHGGPLVQGASAVAVVPLAEGAR
ncbi:DUF3492 domain-containing protein [Streptomyces griseoruber]|uniref:DUF3492 domain-containing protein n=1 Tax=Streptomyces griseoruber TaxID=1943 RepID=UPI00099EB60B|nr:DUF3492 domain-containing protein [Streptomyces griseoruber]